MAWLSRRGGVATPGGFDAVVRLDRHTKDLAKRLQPGEVAVIDHTDIDRVAAESLVAAQAGAVVNVAPSVSGRYPNLGPEILVGAGIPLIDRATPELFNLLREGQTVRVSDGDIIQGDTVVGSGDVMTVESVAAAKEDAKSGMAVQLEAFAANTMEYLKQERDLLLNGVGLPEISTTFEGRHALVVVRGYDYKEDLVALKPYIREYRPVVVGVDGGADALLDEGVTPDVIVGDMDSVSEKALRCGAELIVHAYRDGRAPGMARLEQLGVRGTAFPATGTSEDIAMMIADDAGATLIVAVGTHATLEEFLDKGRAGMASTFLTRLRVGPKLIDAKGVNRLYQPRVRGWMVLLLVLAGMLAILVALAATPTGRDLLDGWGAQWDEFVFWVQELFE
jgi:uncharacterized membrane-anchored protein